METKIDSYIEYELTIGSVELGELIDALNELRYNENLGAINLQFGVKSSNVDENVNIKFIHADKAEALAQAVLDEAAELDEDDVIDPSDCDDSFDEYESYGNISEEDWEAILAALGFEKVGDGTFAEVLGSEPELDVNENLTDVSDRYSGQV